MKKEIGILLKMIGIVLVSIGIGTALLMGVYLLPIEKIDENVKKSAFEIQDEGRFPSLHTWCTSQLNNWSDSRMLIESAFDEGEEEFSLIEKSMLILNRRVEGQKHYDSLIDHYVNGKEYTEYDNYARYWHGYLIVLKPLLMLISVLGIRMLNTVLHFLLHSVIVFLLYKNGLKKYIWPYVISILLIVPLTVAHAISFACVTYIMQFSIITMLLFNEKLRDKNKYMYLFLVIGILTSYFDLLSYPLVTFGMPITLYFCMNTDTLFNNIKKMINYLWGWGIGYIGMWSGKWIAASIFTDENIVLNAINTIIHRSSFADDSGEKVSLIMTLIRNMGFFALNPAIFVAMIFVIILVMRIIKAMKKNRIEMKTLSCDILSYGAICILPFIWYSFTVNHSYVHCWFTCKELIMTSFAGLCMLVNCFEKCENQGTGK